MEVPCYLQAFVEAADVRLATTDGKELPAHRQLLARCCEAFAAGLPQQQEVCVQGAAAASQAGSKRKQSEAEGGAAAAAAAAAAPEGTIQVNVPSDAAEQFLEFAYNPSAISGERLAHLQGAVFWSVLHLADRFKLTALAAAMAAPEAMAARIKSFDGLRQGARAERALSVPAAASDNAWMACLCGIVACSPGPAQLLEMLEWAAAQGHHNLLRLCIAELARALGPERQQVRANNDYQEMSLRLRPRKNYWIPSRPKWSRQQAVALLRSLDFTLLGADGLVQLLDIMTAAGMHRTGKLWNEPAAVVAWQRIGDHAAAAAERATADGDKDECSLAERACTSDSESTDGE
ncbi:hypothetical protein COHA_006429 [Chlorella ohadii]|uniref:BTB domain-containing protein n=1 Tax=Chlorella ohadii TaxID=2649997 RepID=A0AAD5DP30_9CHLO|nr:hypothetical protein COHA_006429 [Chlorella ohadii]